MTVKWASRRPQEVPIVDRDFFFITAFLADTEDEHGELRWQNASRDTSPTSSGAAAGNTSRQGMR